MIHYNHLNKPYLIEDLNGNTLIQWIYAADGSKIQKISHLPSGTATKSYYGNVEFNDAGLEAIYGAEGRIANTNNNGIQAEYYLKDHLGNTRVVFSDRDGSGTITVSDDESTNEVLQESHYYPFGMTMSGPWMMDINTQNDYLYNGKELNKDLGLNWQDYGARFYDPSIGRFTGVDPISDQFAHVSTYNYAENEPVANIDLHGLQKMSAIRPITFPDGTKSVHVRLQAPVITAQRTHGKGSGLGVGITGRSEFAEGISDFAFKSIGGTMAGVFGASAIGSLGSVSLPSISMHSISNFGQAMIAGNLGERATAAAFDIGTQTIFNSATGADFNISSSLSAAAFPKRFFASGLIGSGLNVSVSRNELGAAQFKFNPSLEAGIVGGLFSSAGGNLTQGIGKAMGSNSDGVGIAMASFTKNLPKFSLTGAKHAVSTQIVNEN